MTRGCIWDGGIGNEGAILSYRIPSNFLNILFSFTGYTIEIYYALASSIVTVIYHHDIPILFSYSSVPTTGCFAY